MHLYGYKGMSVPQAFPFQGRLIRSGRTVYSGAEGVNSADGPKRTVSQSGRY